MTKSAAVDEFAETAVLTRRSGGEMPAFEDDPNAQSVYSEYVQELESQLRAEIQKK